MLKEIRNDETNEHSHYYVEPFSIPDEAETIQLGLVSIKWVDENEMKKIWSDVKSEGL